MKEIHHFFKYKHPKLTLLLLWIDILIGVLYCVLRLGVINTLGVVLPFWPILIALVLGLYFRFTYSNGQLDMNPHKDKLSDQYIPYRNRKKKNGKKRN